MYQSPSFSLCLSLFPSRSLALSLPLSLLLSRCRVFVVFATFSRDRYPIYPPFNASVFLLSLPVMLVAKGTHPQRRSRLHANAHKHMCSDTHFRPQLCACFPHLPSKCVHCGDDGSHRLCPADMRGLHHGDHCLQCSPRMRHRLPRQSGAGRCDVSSWECGTGLGRLYRPV